MSRHEDMRSGLAGVDLLPALGLIVAVIATIVPIVSTRIPPLTDFPNHLVRFWLLAGGDHIAPVSSMYAIDWSRSSVNVGLDALFATVGRVVGYMPVARAVLLMAIAGPPIGAVLLNRSVFGRWSSWQIAGLLLAWTTTALFGFLSYQVSLLLALLAACLEPRLQSSRLLGIVARFVFVAVILITHPFGVVFYLFLAVGLAIGPSSSELFTVPRMSDVIRRVLPLAVTVAILIAALYLLAPHPPSGTTGQPFVGWDLTPKGMLLTLASPFLSYQRAADLAFVAIPVAVAVLATATGRMRSHGGLVLAGYLLAVLSLVMPFTLGDASWVTRRLPLMAALTLFAGVQPQPRTGRGAALLTLVLLAVTVGRASWIGGIWAARTQDERAVEHAMRAVPPGAAVLAAQFQPTDIHRAPLGRYLVGITPSIGETTLRHVPALVVLERHAFIPTLFTVAGQQPLRVLPPWNQIAVPSSRVPDVHLLDRPISAADLRDDPYFQVWRTRFNYVIVIGADQADDAGPFVPPPGLTLVSDDGFARLYRIQSLPGPGQALQDSMPRR